MDVYLLHYRRNIQTMNGQRIPLSFPGERVHLVQLFVENNAARYENVRRVVAHGKFAVREVVADTPAYLRPILIEGCNGQQIRQVDLFPKSLGLYRQVSDNGDAAGVEGVFTPWVDRCRY